MSRDEVVGPFTHFALGMTIRNRYLWQNFALLRAFGACHADDAWQAIALRAWELLRS
jgi:hypothetical protein